MKKYLLLLALTATLLKAGPATLDLGSHGKCTLYFPDGWDVAVTDMAGTMTVTVSPTGDANASCTIAVTYPEQDRFDTKSRLKVRVEADGLPVAEGSVEGKAVAREFSVSSGFGFYCNFTDAALKGKPPEKGNYKVTSMGKIHLAADVLMDVQILADDFRGAPYQQLLGAIEGLEFRGK
jgi:hypothetical protein